MFTKIRMRNEKGFTLIELLIVVAIIGILAAIAIPQFANYRKKGYAASLKSDLKNAYTAAQAYLTDNPNALSVSLATVGPSPGQGVWRASASTTYTNGDTMSFTAGQFSMTAAAAACTATITSGGVITSSGC